MLDAHEKHMAIELLETLSWDDLLSLTRTVTDGFIVPLNSQEACVAILQHTSSAEQLLSRQKLTKEVLFTYLHSKKVTFSKSDKHLLKQMVIDLWRKDAPAIYCQLSHTPTTANDVATTHCENNNTTLAAASTEADQLAEKFTEWFYSLLNQSQSTEVNGCVLGTDNFFPDCCIRMHLESASASVDNEVDNDAVGVVKLLLDTKSTHNLYFNPNLTPDGVQGKMDSHGLVLVAACGTLHQGQKCAGVFEQLFGLARDPFSENNWKIKYTEVNLRSQELVTGLPALKDTNLGRTLLALPESTS